MGGDQWILTQTIPTIHHLPMAGLGLALHRLGEAQDVNSSMVAPDSTMEDCRGMGCMLKTPAIEVDQLRVQRGRRDVLPSLTCTIYSGRVTGSAPTSSAAGGDKVLPWSTTSPIPAVLR